jgi:hypothetical protein
MIRANILARPDPTRLNLFVIRLDCYEQPELLVSNEKEVEMNQQEYNEKFTTDKERLNNAVTQASDIRKFEIELYWKRATYFWAFIAVAFAGYFAILAADKIGRHRFLLSLIVACIGFVFTFAWYFANKGGKYWQENWEAHLDLLEDGVAGPLYKTHFTEHHKNKGTLKKIITGSFVADSSRVSVTTINQWVNFYVMIVWGILISFSTYKSLRDPLKSWLISYFPLWLTNDSLKSWLISLLPCGVIFFTILCCIFMYRNMQSSDEYYTVKTTQRAVEISK